MDLMGEYLAWLTIAAGPASTQRREGQQHIKDARRTERRRGHPNALARWWHGLATRHPDLGVPRPTAVAATPVGPPSVELARVLEAAAHHVAEEGTSSERGLLEAMSEVTAQSAPGAAAALVNLEGTEVSRLRAFGIVHTHILAALGPREHRWLLDLLEGGWRRRCPGRVA